MRIVGHGIDIVETQRIRQMLDAHGQRFLARCFTDAEQAWQGRSERRRIERLAGRFAAKEAILKAVGTGWAAGVTWTDAEVVPEPTGRPGVRLHGRLRELAHELGIRHWTLSITHAAGQAQASAIAVGEDHDAPHAAVTDEQG